MIEKRNLLRCVFTIAAFSGGVAQANQILGNSAGVTMADDFNVTATTTPEPPTFGTLLVGLGSQHRGLAPQRHAKGLIGQAASC